MGAEHASRLALAWLAGAEPAAWRELEGTAVLADLSGFTRLTEALTSLGTEGAEVLHRALTVCFAALVEPCLRAGGDVIGYAGDAALVWFDGDDHERRAVATALALPSSLGRVPAAVTGGKRIRVSVGAHTGRFTAVMAGDTQKAMFLCGPDVTTLVRAEAAAGPGSVAVSERLAVLLPAAQRGAALADGIVTVRAAGRSAAPIVGSTTTAGEASADAAARALALLSPSVRALVTSGVPLGDHRAASIGFVSVPGLDGLLASSGPDAVHAVLHRVASTVARVCAELSVTWLDVDVGNDCVRLVLAAGVPAAVDDDEHRLLLALRRIVDESGVAVRAGAQRGRLFAGELGAAGRRAYTVLGDAANVAARALGLAADGELIAADGLGVDRRAGIDAVALGPRSLKNRTRPVEMWRVDAVAPFAGQPRDGARPGARRRVTEADALVAAWKTALAGVGSWTLLAGDEGMGGEELLAEVVDHAGPFATLVGADAAQSRVPFRLAVDLLRLLAAPDGGAPEHASARLAASAADMVGVEAAWAAAALDLVSQRVPVERPGEEPADVARTIRLGFVALVESVAPDPWLLAIDSLDDADDASRQVVLELMARSPLHRWSIVASARSAPSALEGRGAEGRVITLDALDDEAAADLVVTVDPMLRPDQVERIVRAARGNPFVLEELARHPQDGALPDSLERLAVARLDGLDPVTRQLVRDAAAFGATFDPEVVSSVLGRPDLADAGSWVAAHAVVRRSSDGALSFRHDAYWLAAHRALPFQRRRSLHAAIADHLALAPDTDDAVLAYHLEEAGRTREAFPLAARAARSARRAGALAEAAELFSRATAMARTVDRPALGPLLTDQGEALLHLGDLAGAEKSLAAAARLLADPVAYARMCVFRADVEIRRHRLRPARTWLQRGLQLVEPLGADAAAVRCELLVGDSAALYYLGRYGPCRVAAEQALAVAEGTGDAYLLGLVHMHLEMAHSAVLAVDAARAHAGAAIEHFTAIGHHRHLSSTHTNIGLTELHAGRWDEALAHYTAAGAEAAQAGDAVGRPVADMNRGFLLLRRGDLAEADRLGARSQRAFDALGLDDLAAYGRFLRSRVATADGAFVEAEALMAEARAAFDRCGRTGMVVECDVASIDTMQRAGRTDDALDLARSIESGVARADDATVAVAYGLHRALAELRAGDVDGGRARLLASLAAAREHRLPYDVHRCLAALVDVEDAGGPLAPDGARDESAAIAVQLGLAPGNPRVS